MSNINVENGNDTKLGYEAVELTCLLIFIIFKVCIKVSSRDGLGWNQSYPLLYAFLVIHVLVVATCTNIVKLLTCKCNFDIILLDHSQMYILVAYFYCINFLFFIFLTYDKLIKDLNGFFCAQSKTKVLK